MTDDTTDTDAGTETDDQHRDADREGAPGDHGRETMREVDHTHPDTDESFGDTGTYRRGVADEGGSEGDAEDGDGEGGGREGTVPEGEEEV